MFKKGDIVRVIGDEDQELFVVIKSNAKTIYEYNTLGKPKWKIDKTKMIVKPVDNQNYPGQLVLEKDRCEHFMTRKEVKPFTFLK
jgi:uncharacterized protein YqfB (UPF0267 family)